MGRKHTSRSKHFDFILLDLICVEVSLLLAYNIRLGGSGKEVSEYYTLMNVLVILVHIAVAFVSECYSGILRRGKLKELKNVVLHNFEIFAVIFMILFFLKWSSIYSRIMFLLFFCFNTLFMYVVRQLRKTHLLKEIDNKKFFSRMIIVTYKEQAEKVVKGLQSFNYGGFCVDGVILLDVEKASGDVLGIPVVACKEDMYEYVKTHVVDEVFLKCDDEDLTTVANKFLTMGVMVHISMDRFLSSVPNAVMQNINNYTVVTTSVNRVSFKQKIIKRFMDICGGIVGLIFTGILFVIFAPIIYIQSPGPIFFKQNRVGKNGRIFKIYKFRSMYMDAEERKKELMEQNKMSGLMFKMDNDPRIIPIGHFIRKCSIDEFPQFWNVLKGDMSLVGTRPPTVDEYDQYDLHHKSRLAIKPGLTGMWQVSGRSDITDFEEVVKLDNEYIMNFSLSLDIKILFKTVMVVLGKKGSV